MLPEEWSSEARYRLAYCLTQCGFGPSILRIEITQEDSDFVTLKVSDDEVEFFVPILFSYMDKYGLRVFAELALEILAKREKYYQDKDEQQRRKMNPGTGIL